MEKEQLDARVRDFTKALFDGDSQVRLDNVAKSIGLTEDRDIFDVEWEVERLLKEAIKKEEIEVDEIEPIYETVGAKEAMVLWQEEEHILVLLNHGSYVKLHKYRLDNLEQEVSLPSDALQDLRNLVQGMREDLNKLIKAQPEMVQLLDDMEVSEQDTPEDVESLDGPRIMGHDDTSQGLRERHRP